MTKGDAKTPGKEIREVDPRVTEWSRKMGRNFCAVFILYYAIAIIAYSFSLGETNTLAAFARYMESVIPSIQGTAAISPDPNYARLMLAISWIYMIPAYIAFIWNLNLDYCEKRGVDMNGFILSACAALLIGFVWVAMKLPFDSRTGGYRIMLAHDMAKSYVLGITVWSTVIWVLPSVFLFVLTMILPLKIRRIFGKS
jgi:hypothetical protein